MRKKITHLNQRQSSTATVTVEAAITGFYRRCQAKNLSPHTISFYKYRLLAFQRYLDAEQLPKEVGQITSSIIRDFIADQNMRVSSATADDSFVTVRALFTYLVKDDLVTDNPMKGVDRPKTKQVIISTFTTEQIQAMLGICGNDFVGIRNRALILTLIDCGLRVSELCSLQTNDIRWNEQTMLVTGKGNKERIVPFGRTTRSALLTYWERRGDVPATDTFFLTCYGDPINRQRAHCALFECGTKAGVTGLRISPHTFRHTFAVMYLRNGGDVFSLQKMLGHTDLTMTRRYAELSETDVIEKHRQFSPADAIKSTNQNGRKRMK